MSSNVVVVHKGRTNTITLGLGFDVSADTFKSEIRAEPDGNSVLIATWTVSFATTGVDGELILRLDDLVTSQITAKSGYMDLKRTTGGEPVPVFDAPLEVVFQGTVTV